MYHMQLLTHWREAYTNGKNYWIYELDDYDLRVQSEPHDLYSYSVLDKKGNLIRSDFDYEDPESAMKAAESEWENCLKPTPGLSGKVQSFKWRTAERGAAAECRIGIANSVLLQTYRDEETGLWSYYAYYKTVLLVEEEDKCKTNFDAQSALEAWYKQNALNLLHIHSLLSK